MATQKPISTISYNTEGFLRERLQEWLDAHIIQSYMYICHKGEDGDKDHIHLRIEPNKKLDPMTLKEELKEFDPKHPDKPLTVRPWRPSKEEDWILYGEHNEQYLKVKYNGGDKGEKLPYSWQDIKADADFDVEIAHIRALSHMEHTTTNLASRLSHGAKPLDMIMQGENVFQVNAVLRALQSTDYGRVQEELEEVYDRLNKLVLSIKAYGLDVIEDKNGDYKIVAPGINTSDGVEF